jgi:sugar lactone lactonase YvrE
MVVLSNAVATTLIRTYVQQANLAVNFVDNPIGAAWRVNSGAWRESGYVVSNLPAGTNVVEYQDVRGYFRPVDENVDLVPGETRFLTRSYAEITSAVAVVIIPTNAATDGAQWRVDGGAWRNSGELADGLRLGAHIIEFSTPWRWIPPDSVTVTLVDENPVVITGEYSQVTGLSADIFPPDAIATGAMWRVSGGNWTNSGVLLNVPAGTYTVQFKSIGVNWLAPGDMTAVVVDQRVTVVSGTYFPADVFGGNVSTNLGEFLWPHGVTVDAQHRIYVSDTYNNRVQMYSPLNQSWSVLGTGGSGVGQFNQPSGIILDGRGTLYVADRNNNRIQKRNPTNFVWTIVGSNILGSALGQFNSPADVAVDSSYNLYVADFANDRVQRLTTAGVWSVFITNGSTVGRVFKPQGLTVDSADNVYVSDKGSVSNSLSRVQKFTRNGVFVSLLGDNQSANGGLSNGVGMVIGEAGALYLADVLNNRVASLPVAGGWSTLVGSALNNPQDVSWDPRGYLYIADTLNNRVLRIAINAGAVTNGIAQFSAVMPSGTNTAFTISWFANSNWYYSVQYASSLVDPVVWQSVPGCTNIAGAGMMTNCTDRTVLGVTNRYYRIIAY